MRFVKKNREINIVGLPFMDLLSCALGALALILFYTMLNYRPIVEENLRELKLVTEKLPIMHIGEKVEFAFSAQGGLEPYHWKLVDKKEILLKIVGKNKLDIKSYSEYKVGLPHGLNFEKTGIIKGQISDNNINISQGLPITYCFAITVKVDEDSINQFIKEQEENKNNLIENSFDREYYLNNQDKFTQITKVFKLTVWPPKYYKPPVAKAVTLPDAICDKEYKYCFKVLWGTEILKYCAKRK